MTDPYWCCHCGKPIAAHVRHECPDAPDGPFADALADGAPVTIAAVRAGYHAKHGQRVLARIRASLGAQAV